MKKKERVRKRKTASAVAEASSLMAKPILRPPPAREGRGTAISRDRCLGSIVPVVENRKDKRKRVFIKNRKLIWGHLDSFAFQCDVYDVMGK